MRAGLMAVAVLAATGLTVQQGGAQTTAAAPSVNPAEAFGAREAVQDISLSPDGSKIAIIAPTKGRGAAVTVIDATNGDTKTILTSSGAPDRLTDCHWSTESRLICNVYMILDTDAGRFGFTRIVAVNADGSALKVLSAKTGDRALGFSTNGGDLIDWGGDGTGSALMTREFVPESTTGSIVTSSRAGLGVELIDTVSLKRRTIEQPRDGAADYITDGQGNVRVMGIQSATGTGYASNKITYMYRVAGDRGWKPLSTPVVEGGRITGFMPYAVDPTTNVAYGFENETGRKALYSVSLDGSLTRKLVFERPDVDVAGLIRIGRRERVVGVSYVTDKRVAEYFDPDLKALRGALGKALPGKLINFVDSSLDEKKLLLYAGSDVDPGTYYLFDRTRRKLVVVTPARPELAKTTLATVKPITYKAADGTTIPAYLMLPAGSDGKNLPAIVMPHGGPGARDEWGFFWLSQYFAARGYAVIQPNFRGSAGYGDAWYQKNGFVSWKTAIGDVNDAGRWLISSEIADPKKLAIVGWSYGGYAALQSSVLDPDLFKAIVAVAPVTDLETLRGESRNFYSYPQVDAFIGHGPWVTEGSPARNATKIKAPVLLFHGDRDQNVGIGESRLMVDKLRGAGGKVELVEFKGLDHQLDDDTVRATMLAKADAFLRASMGMAP
jgi:dipeptidyl aminopeptidase/acylaminoacyl peptidase